MHFFSTLLMAGGGDQDMTPTFIMMIGIFVVFYFFMIRPQQKKLKDAKKFREAIQKGDKVITIGGIHGKVLEVKENVMILEAEGGQKLRVERSAISPELTNGSGPSSLQQEKGSR